MNGKHRGISVCVSNTNFPLGRQAGFNARRCLSEIFPPAVVVWKRQVLCLGTCFLSLDFSDGNKPRLQVLEQWLCIVLPAKRRESYTAQSVCKVLIRHVGRAFLFHHMLCSWMIFFFKLHYITSSNSTDLVGFKGRKWLCVLSKN